MTRLRVNPLPGLELASRSDSGLDVLGACDRLRPDPTGRMIAAMRRAVFVIAIFGSLTCGVGGASSSTTAAPTARQVVVQLRAAGFPVGKIKVYSRSSDGNHLLGRPGQYTGKVNFRDQRIKDGGGGFAVTSGGSVEVFATTTDAKRRFDYVSAIFKSASPSIVAEYDYLEGNAFLRLSQALTPTQAKKYEAEFRRLV